MIAIGLMLAVIMMGFEIYLINTYPWVKRLLHTPARTLVFSIGLSLALTALFPMAGICAFIGAIGSTLGIQPYYAWMRRWPGYHARWVAFRTRWATRYNTVRHPVIRVRGR